MAYPIRLGTDTLNSMKAIWTRPKDEVTEEEYREFYKHVSRDWNDPLEHLSHPRRGQPRGAGAALHPVEGALRSLARRRPERGAALRAARVHHGRLQGAAPALAPLRPRRRRLRRSVAQRVARDPPAEPPDPGDPPASRPPPARRPQGDEGRAAREVPDASGRSSAPCSRRGCSGWTTARSGSSSWCWRRRRHGTVVPTSLGEYVARMKEGQPAIYYMTGPSRRGRRAVAPPRGRPRQGLRGALLHRSAGRAVAAPAPRVRGQAARVRGEGRRHAGLGGRKEAGRGSSGASRRRASRICCSCCARSCRTTSRTCGCRAGSPRPPPAWWARRAISPRAWPRCSAGRASRCRWPSASSS